jgi:hypothetical protein
MGGRLHFFVTSGWQKRRKGLLLISRPTEVGTRAGRPARALHFINSSLARQSR